MLVMIDCKLDDNDSFGNRVIEPSFGAGIIFGFDSDHLYIVTVRHIVFSFDDSPAQNIEVKFFGLGGESIKAELTTDNDRDLDIAVLYVKRSRISESLISSIPFRCLGNPDDSKRGDLVYLLGYNGHEPWESSVGLDRMKSVQANILEFESAALTFGYSGGALMDDSWRIIGINRITAPSNGLAVRIDAVTSKLSAWGYTVRLGVRPKVEPPAYSETIDGVGIEMVRVPAGRFLMGSSAGGGTDEHPQHEVTLSTFYMGKYEVTQLQWRSVMQLPKERIYLKPNPSYFKGDNLPVEQVSWEEAVEFCERLSRKTERTYRLPTEAEWEYACRAGTTGPYAGDLKAMAWYSDNSDRRTHPVGSKQANSFGLYDMYGNVWEWCVDWYLAKYYSMSPKSDPRGPNSGSNRTRRGGSWQDSAPYLRSAHRDLKNTGFQGNNLGFRLVMTYN